MAINMELTLFLHMFILITVNCTIAQEEMSQENINEILDKLIVQTKSINETGPNSDIRDLTPDDETQPGNESNIYYFKTYMAPHINFKSSSETLQASRHSNKTSHEVYNQDHDLTSEDEPSPGASKISRKSFIGVEQHKQYIMPRFLHGGQENDSEYSEYKSRAGHIDDNDYSLEDLLKKEIVSELSTTNDNTRKQISFTQSGHQNQQLSILHNYPEIIIDHITYDTDENDNNKTVKIKSTQDMQNIVKTEPNNTLQNLTPRKIRYNIPGEEFEIADHDPPELFGLRNYVTPEIKGLIDAIIQKKAMHDALLKQTTESESRKQSILLEKILQRLPEKRQMSNNVKSSYSLRHDQMAPAEMETLSHLRSSLETSYRSGGNHLKKSYLNAPFVPSKWEIHNRLLRTLVRMCRPEVLKRTRLVAALIDRIVPNIDYRPVYYDMYKK